MITNLYFLFLKLGFLSFGGGYPMMALILSEGAATVGLTNAEFADMAALELLASGPIAINSATYIGYIKGGLLGSIAATLGVCTSPFILSTLLYYVLNKFKDNKILEGFLNGIKIACGGLLISTALTLSKSIIFNDAGFDMLITLPLQYINLFGILLLTVFTFFLIKFKTNPIIIILVAGIIGVIFIR